MLYLHFLFFDIFVQFLSGGEVEFVAVVAAVEIAVCFVIAPADLRPFQVNIAAIILIQIFAAGRDVDIPVPVLDEHRNALVGQIPADVVVIAFGGRFFDWQSQVIAAEPGTFFTKNLAQNRISNSIIQGSRFKVQSFMFLVSGL